MPCRFFRLFMGFEAYIGAGQGPQTCQRARQTPFSSRNPWGLTGEKTARTG